MKLCGLCALCVKKENAEDAKSAETGDHSWMMLRPVKRSTLIIARKNSERR